MVVALVPCLDTQPQPRRKAKLPAAMLAGTPWECLISLSLLYYPLQTSQVLLGLMAEDSTVLYGRTHRGKQQNLLVQCIDPQPQTPLPCP